MRALGSSAAIKARPFEGHNELATYRCVRAEALFSDLSSSNTARPNDELSPNDKDKPNLVKYPAAAKAAAYFLKIGELRCQKMQRQMI
jgi:hypothetical protein